MDLKRLAGAVRRLLPTRPSQFVRAVGTAVLTPIAFSLRTGHFRSALRTQAVDAAGDPLPWYTYPAIEFLAHQDVADKRVLEWGAGQSTVWWTRRAASVTAFDSDPAWVEWVRRAAPRAVLHNVPDDLTGVDRFLAGATFDLIVIDGLDRDRCARRSVDLLADGGAIIFDNSEGYWGPEGEYPILDLFREQGFQRVDFYGYAPGVFWPHCTSVFFRSHCFLFSGAAPPGPSPAHASGAHHGRYGA